MTEERRSDLQQQALVHQVREAVRLRASAPVMSRGESQTPLGIDERSAPRRPHSFGAPPAPLPVAEPVGEIAMRPEYSLAEFTRFHDEAFVRNAYRGVLRRDPDPSGIEAYLTALRTARLSKPEILGRLRYSAEGRAAGVRVRGLPLAYAWRRASRARVLGRILGIAEYFVRLPDTAAHLQRLEAEVFQHHPDAVHSVAALAGQLEEAYALQDARVSELAATVSSGFAAADERRARIEQRIEVAEIALATRMSAIASELKQECARLDEQGRAALATSESLRADVREAQALLAGNLDILRADLEETRRRIATWLGAEPAIPDAAYAAFESAFRGTREEIKGRIAVYLPSIREACAATGAPVLDVGCGRGEWLELLREHGLAGRGVDLNEAMIEQCLAGRLDVVLDDGLTYLRNVDDHSLGAVTAFHIIEHLPFSTLLALISETERVLRPGGVAIFESPNPENLIVGACNFYFDPTHRSPIPPPLLEFFVQQAGFSAVAILRLHPSEVPEGFTVGDPFVRNWLFGPQDYAVIGRKPAANTADKLAEPQ